MAVFLVHYQDFADDVQVLRFETPQKADIYGFERLPPDRTAKVVESEDTLRDPANFSTNLLIKIHNKLVTGSDKTVSKFENRAAAARRTFAIIYGRFNQLDLTEVASNPPSPSPLLPNKSQETTLMPKTASAKKASTSGGRKSAAKAAGTTGDFKPTRAGTDRAKVLELMDGTRTAAEIASEMGGRFDEKYVMAHAYCLRRDCGIDYKVTEDKLIAVYPDGLSIADAVKQPTPKGAAAPSQPPAPQVVEDTETVDETSEAA